jgi:hypothetical protein
VAVFARQMSLPVPAVLFLMMAGALGESAKLSLPAIILTGVVGCLMADFAWFQAIRQWGRRILRILCSFSADSRYCAQRARDVFSRWGLRTLMIMIAKFIPGLDAVLPPIWECRIRGHQCQRFKDADLDRSDRHVGLEYLKLKFTFDWSLSNLVALLRQQLLEGSLGLANAMDAAQPSVLLEC